MGDVKDKVKGFINKVSNPFSSSSSSSGKFKGQGRVLGSSSTTSSPHQPHRPIRQPPPPRSNPETQRRHLPAQSGEKAADLGTDRPYECPVCKRSFVSEEEVDGHLELCLESEGRGGEEVAVAVYLSGGPPEGSVEVMVRLLGNLAREPENEKFRKVRMGNPKIKEAVGDVEGAVGVLECVGFVIGEKEGEVWATMEAPSGEKLVRIREVVAMLQRRKEGDGKLVAVSSIELQERADGAKEIDRQVRVFFPVPGSIEEEIELSDSFYNLSAQELKREAESRKKKIADSQLLIPKSYKEKQMQAARKKYKSTIIRIQFPDGVVLQGVFRPSEPTSVLYEFVSSALKEQALEFDLLIPEVQKPRLIHHSPTPGGKKQTLEEEGLVPSALLKFRSKETDLSPFTGLRSELLEAGEPLVASSTANRGGLTGS